MPSSLRLPADVQVQLGAPSSGLVFMTPRFASVSVDLLWSMCHIREIRLGNF